MTLKDNLNSQLVKNKAEVLSSQEKISNLEEEEEEELMEEMLLE